MTGEALQISPANDPRGSPAKGQQAAGVGGVMFVMYRLPFVECLMFGALISATDPVNAAGDLCAICQEKMHAPILLHCKHIFCEDCVSEWFERERTCPLCRALVKAADLISFGDGSTSLFFQIF